MTDRVARREAALARVEAARVALDAVEQQRAGADAELRAAIVAADDARVPHTDIGRVARMHRNTVRRVVDTDRSV